MSCVDDAPKEVGTFCATNAAQPGVCNSNHECVECAAGASCSTNPSAPCRTGVIVCSSGAPVCTDDDDASALCGGGTKVCQNGACQLPTSCSQLAAVGDLHTDGLFTIDPDRTDAMPPFDVWCDMTTEDGGWTVLPLRLADPTMWNVALSGASCVTMSEKTNSGTYRQHHSALTSGFAETSFTFAQAIRVSQVRLDGLSHSNGGTCNSMDFDIGGVFAGQSSAHEAWYFSGANASDPRAFVFSDDVCDAPYSFRPPVVEPANCTKDLLDAGIGTASTGFSDLTKTLSFSSANNVLQMTIVQGCSSTLCSQTNEGERFFLNQQPDSDGVWRKGILVR